VTAFDQGSLASAGVSPDTRREVRRRIDGPLKPEATIALFKVAKCHSCAGQGIDTPMVANNRPLHRCPVCGADAPAPTDYQEQKSTITDGYFFPWHARALLWIGKQFFALARWIERK